MRIERANANAARRGQRHDLLCIAVVLKDEFALSFSSTGTFLTFPFEQPFWQRAKCCPPEGAVPSVNVSRSLRRPLKAKIANSSNP